MPGHRSQSFSSNLPGLLRRRSPARSRATPNHIGGEFIVDDRFERRPNSLVSLVRGITYNLGSLRATSSRFLQVRRLQCRLFVLGATEQSVLSNKVNWTAHVVVASVLAYWFVRAQGQSSVSTRTTQRSATTFTMPDMLQTCSLGCDRLPGHRSQSFSATFPGLLCRRGPARSRAIPNYVGGKFVVDDSFERRLNSLVSLARGIRYCRLVASRFQLILSRSSSLMSMTCPGRD